MAVLVLIAFVAGMVTAVSPCVLPVLPIIFGGGATGSERRPYAVVAGLVVSFTFFTLAATAILSAIGLPDDLFRNIAIAIVLLVALSLLWPRLGDLLERPFAALGRRAPGDVGSGFALGVSLGLLFTPCAGPVIAAVATVAATQSLSWSSVVVTAAYALGAGLVLLGVALGARRGLSLRPLRAHAVAVRRALGVLMAGAAVLMIVGLDTRLATHVPAYTRTLQGLEETSAAKRGIADLVGDHGSFAGAELRDYGPAPEFAGIGLWLKSRPLTMRALRGKVVLIDFWTYSCVNCLRTLPYLERWYATYKSRGLVIVGVHTPEFAFEHVPANVRRAVRSLGVAYPVALDNDYETWTAWNNHYWPAEYFVDRRGHVRFAHFGEGEYERSERIIRTLLDEPGLPALVSRHIRDQTPQGVETPETYLGYERLATLVGSPVVEDREATYRFPVVLPANHVAYAGRWTVERERIVAGRGARIRLAFHARNVFLVLGAPGRAGTVGVRVDGRPFRTVRITEHRLYALARLAGRPTDHILDLAFSPGVEAYAFTFG